MMMNDKWGWGILGVHNGWFIKFTEWLWNYIVCKSVCPHGVYSDNCDNARELHRSFCTEKSLCRGAFIRGNILQNYIFRKELLHTNAFTQKSLRRGAFTHRSLYRENRVHSAALTHKRVYTKKFLYTNFFHRETVTQTNLHTHTQKLLHSLHRRTFTHRCFTQRNFCTGRCFFYTDAFTHKRFYTQKIFHKGTFTQWTLATKDLVMLQNHNFTPVFAGWPSFRSKGLHLKFQHRNFTPEVHSCVITPVKQLRLYVRIPV